MESEDVLDRAGNDALRSPLMNTDDLRAASRRLAKDGFWMSVPPRPRFDADILMMDAAAEIDLLRAALAELEAENADLKDQVRAMLDGRAKPQR